MTEDSSPDLLDALDDDIVVEFDPAFGVFTGSEEAVTIPREGSGSAAALAFDDELAEALEGAVQRITGEFQAVRSASETGTWTQIPRATSSTSSTVAAEPLSEEAPSEVSEEPPSDHQRTVQLDAEDLLSLSGPNFSVAPPAPPTKPATESGDYEQVQQRRAAESTISGFEAAETSSSYDPTPRATATLEKPTAFKSTQSFAPLSGATGDYPAGATDEREPNPAPFSAVAPEAQLDSMLEDYFGSASDAGPMPTAQQAAEHALGSASHDPVPTAPTGPVPSVHTDQTVRHSVSREAIDSLSRSSSGAFPAVTAAPGKPTPRVETLPLPTSATSSEGTPHRQRQVELLETHFGEDAAPSFEAPADPSPVADSVVPQDAAHGSSEAKTPTRTPVPEADGSAAEDSDTESLLRAYLTGHNAAPEESRHVPRMDTDDLLAAYLSDPAAMPNIPRKDEMKRPPGRLIRPPGASRTIPVGTRRSSDIVEKRSGLSKSGEARRVGAHLEAAEARREALESGAHEQVPDFSQAFTSEPTTSRAKRTLEPRTSPDSSRAVEHSVERWSPRAQHKSDSGEFPAAEGPRGSTPSALPHLPAERSETMRLKRDQSDAVLDALGTRPASVSEEFGGVPRMAPNSEDNDTIQLSEQHAIEVLQEYISLRSQPQDDESSPEQQADAIQDAPAVDPEGPTVADLATREIQLSSSDADEVLRRYVQSVSRSGSHRAARGIDDE